MAQEKVAIHANSVGSTASVGTSAAWSAPSINKEAETEK